MLALGWEGANRGAGRSDARRAAVSLISLLIAISH